MALTITQPGVFDKLMHEKYVILNVTADNSYPTGGYAITPSRYGLTKLDMVFIDGGNGYGVQYDYTNNKIMFYTTAGTETTNATNLSAITFNVMLIGI